MSPEADDCVFHLERRWNVIANEHCITRTVQRLIVCPLDLKSDSVWRVRNCLKNRVLTAKIKVAVKKKKPENSEQGENDKGDQDNSLANLHGRRISVAPLK